MKELFCISLLSILNFVCWGQIKLPAEFHCVLGEGHPNESYFTNGKITFKTYPWGHEGLAGIEVVDNIQDIYNQKIKFQRTKDYLYWATGKADGKYIYIVLADEAIQFTVKSDVNDKVFSDYCVWLLKEIRREMKTTKELYFTNYKGSDCFGLK